jgi:hypothetical protein
MDIVVVFRYLDITDPNDAEADEVIEDLTATIEEAGVSCDSWHIEEAFGECMYPDNDPAAESA